MQYALGEHEHCGDARRVDLVERELFNVLWVGSEYSMRKLDQETVHALIMLLRKAYNFKFTIHI